MLVAAYSLTPAVASAHEAGANQRLRVAHRYDSIVLRPPGARQPHVTAVAAWRRLREQALDPAPAQALVLAEYADETRAVRTLAWVSIRHGQPLVAKGSHDSRVSSSTFLSAVDATNGRVVLPRYATGERTTAQAPIAVRPRRPVPAGYAASNVAGIWHLVGVEPDDRTVSILVAEPGCDQFRYLNADPTAVDGLTITAVLERWRPVAPRHACAAVLGLRRYRVRLPDEIAGRRIDGDCVPGTTTVDERYCASLVAVARRA